MKFLIVGDPHVRADDIEDCENLLKGVLQTALAEKPDAVIFLGDLFHNHSIVHLTVLNFWQRWFSDFKRFGIKVIALKGNHDFGLSNPSHHALEPFKELAQIVDVPATIVTATERIRLLPYYGSKRAEEFYEAVKDPYDIVFCHETFDGAQYDNGFYAPDGFDQTKVNAPLVISGHIHTASTLRERNTVQYPGSPRWMTASDANQVKTISMLDTDGMFWQIYPTDIWCNKILTKIITSENDLADLLKGPQPRSTTTLTLKGDKATVERMRELVKDKGFLIKQAIEKQDVTVKESLGVKEAYVQFMKDKMKTFGYSEEKTTEMIGRNIKWITG